MNSRRWKHNLLTLADHSWTAFFGAWGWLRRPQALHWSSPGGQRIMVIAPHPDDEVIGCGGTIIRHVQAGDQVKLLLVTDGRRSRAQGLDPEEMAARRQQEAFAAGRMLTLKQIEWLGLPEGSWATEEFQESFQASRQAFRPDIIYAPSRIDFHPEHHHVAYVLARALADSALPPPGIRIYQMQVPLTPQLVNLISPTAEVDEQIQAAFRAYTTQWASISRIYRLRRYDAALFQTRPPLEVFWELTTRQYIQLHELPPAFPWSTHTFRSLRPLPATDFLAYQQGRRERKRLIRQLLSAG